MVRSMLGPGWALALLLLAHGIDRRRVVTPCASRSDRKAPCLGVRGRVSLTNGNPNVRVWHVGTKRVFGGVGIGCTEHPCGPSAMPDSFVGTDGREPRPLRGPYHLPGHARARRLDANGLYRVCQEYREATALTAVPMNDAVSLR